MRLKPDLELLERIGILNPFDTFHRGPYLEEIEKSDFESLSPFLTCWGAGEALQELFFYQLNFVPICQPPKHQTLRLIQENQTYFQSREKLAKMDFNQLKGIKLIFGKRNNGIKADLPPDLVKYFGDWIKKELEAEKTAETTPAEKLKELKEIEKTLKQSKLKIQKALPSVEAILKAKSPDVIFELKQIIHCAYGIFYQRGYRLKPRKNFSDELDPFSNSFDKKAAYDILKRE